MDLIIKHNKGMQQFFTVVNGKVATVEYFKMDNGIIDFYRTFVPTELRGYGIGEEIVLFALNYAITNEFKIIPSCPFVTQVIKKHPELKISLLQE